MPVLYAGLIDERNWMTNREVSEQFEVVFSGGELLPGRDQKPDPTWEAPKRKYNKPPSSAEGQPKDDNG
jgi:hypothetical protein